MLLSFYDTLTSWALPQVKILQIARATVAKASHHRGPTACAIGNIFLIGIQSLLLTVTVLGHGESVTVTRLSVKAEVVY